MKKRHLEIVKTEAPKKITRQKKYVIDEDKIKHLENDTLKFDFSEKDEDYACITFEYTKENKEKIKFEIELVLYKEANSLLIEMVRGTESDETRLIASKVMGEILQAIRFLHKEKLFHLSKYHIVDEEEYRNRLTPTFLNTLEKDIEKIYHQTKRQPIDPDLEFLMTVDGLNHLFLIVVGEDGKKLCELLEKLELASYREVVPNHYEIIFEEYVDDELLLMNWKYHFEKQLFGYGYNVFVDYEDEEWDMDEE